MHLKLSSLLPMYSDMFMSVAKLTKNTVLVHVFISVNITKLEHRAKLACMGKKT